MTSSSAVELRGVEVEGRPVDIATAGGSVTVTAPGTAAGTGPVFAGNGRAAIPGLHDHHIHLLAMAARRTSVALGPPGVTAPAEFDAAVSRFHREAAPEDWLRGVDHEDEVAGPVDRERLDRLAPGRAVRVQHHSGALWTLSSAAIEAIGITRGEPLPDGVELDADGAPTGRMWRLDSWLRQRLPAAATPDLRPVGRQLAAWGLTGVTDATPSVEASSFRLLADAVADGALPLDVTVTGGVEVATLVPPSPLRRGPVKLIVADHRPDDVDTLAAGIRTAHDTGRPVAIHCVSRTAAAIALAAWSEAGAAPGDRMEHASVIDQTMALTLAALGITVVTQPAFVRDRGDHYLAHVERHDRDDLYRCASLLAAGVGVGGSSDAPHGDANPWAAIAAAVDRRSATARTVGVREALPAGRALGLYLGPADDPGGPPRRLTDGATADLCVLDRPLAAALADPAAVTVVLTLRRGSITYVADRSLLH